MTTSHVDRQVSFSAKSLIALVGLTTLYSITLAVCTAFSIKMPGAVELLWLFGFSFIVTWWVRADSRSRDFSLPYEFGTFVFFAWPVVVPYYTYRSRGWKGLLLGVGICMLKVVPYVVSAIVYIYKFMK